MSDDAEQLIVQLEARVTDFEKQMQKAAKTAGTSYAGMKTDSKSATASMEADMVAASRSISASLATTAVRIGEVGAEFAALRLEGYRGQFLELGKSMLAPILALATLDGAIEAVKGQIERADSSGKLAQAMGLSVESLTQLEYAAQMADVPIDTLSTGLRQLSNNALKTIQSPSQQAALAFKTLGISVTTANGQVKPTNQLFDEIAGKFATMQNGATKTGLAMQLFGRSGALMIPILNEGADGLKEMADQSDRLGLTISGKAAAAAAEFMDQLKQLEDRFQGIASTVVQDTLPALEGAVTSLSDLFAEAGQGGPILDLLEGGIRDISSFIVQLTGAVQQAVDVFEGLNVALSQMANGKSPGWQTEAWFNTAAKDGAAADAKAKAILAGTYQPPTTEGANAHAGAAAPPPIATTGGATQASKIDSVTASLNRQIAALGETSRQQAEQNALAKAGIDANSKYASGIITLADKLYDAKAAQQSLNDAQHLFADTFESGLEGVLKGTESLNQALGDLLQTIGDAVLKAALLGEGPLAGILGDAPAQSGGMGGLFGAIAGGLQSIFHFADGTNSAPGGLSLVGERGPELMNVPRGSQVIPAAQTQQMLSGGGGDLHMTNHFTINAQGAVEGTAVQIANAVNYAMRFQVPAVIRQQLGNSWRQGAMPGR